MKEDDTAPKATTQTTSSLSNAYEKMFEEGLHSDITIKVDDKLIPAHKFILAQSSVLADMFGSGWMPKNNVLEINDFSFEIMHSMIKFLYCHKLENLEAIAADLMMCANRFKLPLLQQTCVEWLDKNLSFTNFATALIAADLLKIESLTTSILKYIVV